MTNGKKNAKHSAQFVSHGEAGDGLEGVKEEFLAMLDNQVAFTLPIFGGLDVPSSVVGSWIVMAFLVLVSIGLTRNLKMIPGRAQVVLEMYVSLIDSFAKQNIGHHGRAFTAYLGTLGLYLGFANISGIWGMTPPTKDVNVAIGCAISATLVIYGAQFRYHGFERGLRKFAEPMPLLLPINLMEVVVRPLSLSMRLFGNVLSAFIIMEMIKMVCGYVLPIPFCLYFDLFDGLIQAVVFVFLTTLFISESVE